MILQKKKPKHKKNKATKVKQPYSNKCVTIFKSNDETLNEIDVASNLFLHSIEWRTLRMKAFVLYGNSCQCCGANPKTGAILNVDHIKPRKHFPKLALEIKNLQILCNVCNHGKGNWNLTDWR